MPTSFSLFVMHECETKEKKDLSIIYLWNTLKVVFCFYYMCVRIAIIVSASAVLTLNSFAY